MYVGTATQGHTPEWRPLLAAVGEEVAGDFMWMFEVELSNGVRLQAYKHVDSRCYVHLDAAGSALVFEPSGRYRTARVADVFAAAFAPLPRLVGPTAEQISASWRAVARLRSDTPV